MPARIKDTVAAWERADYPPGLVVHTPRQEALELALALVEDSEGCVPRAGEITGRLEQLMQNRLEVQLRHQCSSHRQQALQLALAEPTAIRADLTGFVSGHDDSNLNARGPDCVKLRSLVAALRR